MDLVAVHAGHIKALLLAGSVEHGVVARALGAETEIVTHQHIANAQTFDQHLFDEGLRRLAGQTGIEGQHHDLVHPAALEFEQLVAQGGDARRGQLGLVQCLGKVVARMRLEGHDAAGHTPVRRFVAQQGEHGLVATVHTIEIADGQGAGGGQVGVVKTAENLHGAAVGRTAPGPYASWF